MGLVKSLKLLIDFLRSKNRKDVNKRFGFLDSFDGFTLRGWSVENGYGAKLVLLKDGKFLKEIDSNRWRRDLVSAGYGECSYEEILDDLASHEYDNKNEFHLSVQFKNTGVDLNGSPITIYPRNVCASASYGNGFIKGWIKDLSNPDLKFKLTMTYRDQHFGYVLADKYSLEQESHHAFCIDLERYELVYESLITLSAETLGMTFPIEIEHEDIKGGSFNLINDQHSGSILDRARCGGGCPLPMIVLPVYDGVEEVIACIKSIYRAKYRQAFNLLVIDDCGPNTLVKTEVQKLQKEFGFEYLQNDKNRGFVETANIGMFCANVAMADVVLLNSDTVVTDYWLDNLREACYREANIGTVTPMSNNASIFSYPKPVYFNDFPTDLNEIPELGRLFNENSNDLYDVPTAHGFCMYIRVDALREVGLFDTQKWGLGYGEENDLSMRMRSHGWRNVMITNTYIYHHGSVSFSDRAESLMAENLSKLIELYPNYHNLIANFISLDPARLARNNVSKKLLLRTIKAKSVLIVRHNFGGGTATAIDNLIRKRIKDGFACYTLKSVDSTYWVLVDEKTGLELKLSWRTEYKEIIDLLSSLNLEYIDYHNVLEFSERVKSLPHDLGIPYTIQVHDYYLLCPRITLTNETGNYCGEPDSTACNQCIKKNHVHDSLYIDEFAFGGDIAKWRNRNALWLEKAKEVVVPDDDVEKRLLNYFDIQNIVVFPHETNIGFVSGGAEDFKIRAPHKSQNSGIVVAVVGAIGSHKGLYNLLDLCAAIQTRPHQKVEIKIVGYTENDELFSSYDFVSITGLYNPSDLNSLLSEVDVVFFPGEVPETYSYVLSEVLMLNKVIVAMDIGAIGSRLRKLSSGHLLSLPFEVEKAYEVLCSIPHSSQTKASNHGTWLPAC